MGASGSKGHNMVPARFALPERVYEKGAAPVSVGRRERAARLAALRSGKAYNALASNSAYARAGRSDIARGLKARAAAALWAARRQRLSNAASRVASATRKGVGAAAGAVATGLGALGTGVGAAGSFLGSKAKAAYNAAAAKTRNAYKGLRALSLKRRAKNFFLGKKALTDQERAVAARFGLNPNSTEFRSKLAKMREGNASAQKLGREGGVRAKVASLTRKAKAGLAAAAAVAGRGVVAAKNAVTKKAGNWYAYSRNMVKYGRRRSDLERLESAKGRAKGAQNKAFSAIQRARNANAAAKAAAEARDKKLKEVQAGLTKAASNMGKAAAAAGRGAGAAAATAAKTGLQLLSSTAKTAKALGKFAGSSVMGGLGALGRAASTLKAKLSSNSAHKRGSSAKKSLFGRRPNNNKGANNGAPKPSALRAATAKLRTAASAVGTALRAAPGKVGSALATAGSSVAGAIGSVGTAIGSAGSAATRSARRAGSSLANAVRYRVGALRNASVAYSASLARRKQASANRRAGKPALNTVVEGNGNNGSASALRPRSASGRSKQKTD